MFGASGNSYGKGNFKSLLALYGLGVEFVGNREMKLPIAGPLPRDVVAFCARAALVYHLQKR